MKKGILQTTQERKVTKSIAVVAEEFAALNREIKRLQHMEKGLKNELIRHAKDGKLDDKFQFHFGNGVYVSMRIKEELVGDEKSVEGLVAVMGEYEGVVRKEIDEKVLFVLARRDKEVIKVVKGCGCDLVNKTQWAVYNS